MKTRILAVLLLFGCATLSYPQTQKELLDQAYEEQSLAKLSQFFSNWTRETKPNNNAVQNDTLKEVYSLFKDIYSPLSISELKSNVLGAYFYQFANYFIVQSYFPDLGMVDKILTQREIATQIMGELRKQNITDTAVIKKKVMEMRENFSFLKYQPTSELKPILREATKNKQFFPEVTPNRRSVVYLTNEYRNVLTEFLGNEANGAGFTTTERKQSFLAIMAVVLRGKFNSGWIISTFPHIYALQFDKSLKRARIIYRVGYEIGSAVVVKTGTTWRLDFVENLREN